MLRLNSIPSSCWVDASSHRSMVTRAEQVVGVLSNCVVCDGWKFDRARAAKFLQKIR
jgi:hypothetical protein